MVLTKLTTKFQITKSQACKYVHIDLAAFTLSYVASELKDLFIPSGARVNESGP